MASFCAGGESAAKRLVLDGRPVTAAEAYRLRLVDELVPSGKALEFALGWAEWLATRTPGVLAGLKDLIVASRQLDQSSALRQELALFVSRFQDQAVMDRVLDIQHRYDEGADSYQAFGIPRV